MGLASRGLRDMDEGLRRVVEAAERAALRRRALGILLRSLAWTAAVMVVVLLLP